MSWYINYGPLKFGKNPLPIRRKDLSILKCLISLDPYALWIPEISFSFCRVLSIGIVYFAEQSCKQLTSDPFTGKQIVTSVNDLIENGPYNSCITCVLLEYERAYRILPVDQVSRIGFCQNLLDCSIFSF